MKRPLIPLLQGAVILIAVAALTVLIRFPLTEGRARNLDLFSIYSDPFILYGYAVSVVFFITLYKVFRLLGYIRQKKVHSLISVRTVKSIKHCAILLCACIVIAGLYVRMFHNESDDPAGSLAICMIAALLSVAIAITAARFEKNYRMQ